MDYGITTLGFNPKRFPEVKKELEDNTIAAFPNILVTPGSVNGTYTSIFAKPITDLWEAIALLYHMQHPSEAEGIHLDFVVDYNGLTRLAALPTVTEILLKGDSGTVVDVNTQFRSSVNNSLHKLEDQITLTNENLQVCVASVDTVEEGETCTITIDEHEYSYVVQGGDTEVEIRDGLLDEIEDFAEATVEGEAYGTRGLKIFAISNGFTIGVNEYLSLWNIGEVHSIEFDVIPVTEEDLTEIETPVSGLDASTNLVAGITGRKIETDTELRIRREKAISVGGGRSLESITARILDEVPLVTSVVGFENRTSEEVDGRPPHSFELIVTGGDPQEIAQKIWDLKPAGIQTYGTEEVEITDSNGDTQMIYFSVPTPKYVWLKITLTKYTDDGVYPDNGDAMIKSAIIAQSASVTIGQDLIPEQYKTGVFYSSPGVLIPGIESAVIEAGVSDDPEEEPDPYVTIRIELAENEVLTFDDTRITIIEA